MLLRGLQQVVVDLRTALPASDHRDIPATLEGGFVGEISGCMHRLPGIARVAARRKMRHTTDADDQLSAAILERRTVRHAGHHIARLARVVIDLQHLIPEAQVVQLRGRPFAVAIEFLPCEIPVFPDVIAIEPALQLAVIEVAQGTGGIGHRHQIGEKRILQRRAIQQHARMPAEVALLLEKQAAHAFQRSSQTSQPQIAGPDAYGNEIVWRIDHRCRILWPVKVRRG